MQMKAKIDKYLDLARKNAVEYEGNGDTNYSWCTWNSPQSLGGKKTGEIKNQEESRPSRPQHC